MRRAALRRWQSSANLRRRKQSARANGYHSSTPARNAGTEPPDKGVIAMRKEVIAAAAALATLLVPLAGNAAEVQVKMLNRGSQGIFVFEPALVKINPGDSVKFVAADKGHDVESISGMLPAGAAPFKAPMSQDTTVTFTKAGVYGYKCRPHYGMGMVGLIVVGNPGNVAEAKAVNQLGRAKTVFAGLFAKLGTTQAAAK
jgi:pseudoazurin